ncbi:MAG: Zn-dependent protease [Candidatus Rokubacteria bacterium CSP1-6]|nr:MAG: Zn-dependent protease [Candidatus Rokubacteria bacterium CSP1-6]
MKAFIRFVLVAVLVVVFAGASAPGADEVLEATLDNGLRVLLLEDHRSPVVSFQVWYRVGSRNERPGATGLAHLLEHMMFKGTPTYGPRMFSTLVEQNGGQDNAFTSQDHTSYFVNVSADKLDLIVALESDRMRNLLLDPKDFESERQVVMEERRTRTEDDPEGFLGEELSAIAFVAHPYRSPIVGWMEDLRGLTVEELRAFYRTYYVPNNALVAAAGDFKAPELLEKIRRAFGPIPRAADPPPLTVAEPRQNGERRVTVKKEAQLPLVFIGYPVPNFRSPDALALELLSTILSEGRSSRLYRRLVYEQQIALNAGGDYSYFSTDPNLFWFFATALPGQTPEALERALMKEVERLKTEPVSATELERAKNQIEASFVFRQDSVYSRASLLARFELLGGWRLRDGFVPAIRAVTAADLQRVARAYFPDERRNVGVLLPIPPGSAPRS